MNLLMIQAAKILGTAIVVYYGLLQALSSPPKPHAFVSLPVQSQMNFLLITRITILLLAAFFTLGLRWPSKAIFVDLDMLAYYFIINTCITLGLAFFAAGVMKKNVSSFRIGLIIAMGMVLPLLVLFISNNLGSVRLSFAELADLYTLFILVFSPLEFGSIAMASSASGNLGSPSSAGIGSSSSAGIGSSSAGIPEESINAAIEATKKNLLEQAIKAAQLDMEKEAKSSSMSDSDIEKAKLHIEQNFRSTVERIKREGPTTSSDHAMVRADRGVEKRLRLEFERINLLDPETGSNPTPFWEKLIKDHSPSSILDILQGSGLSNIHSLSEDDKSSVYAEILAKNIIKYVEFPKEMKLSQRLAIVLDYSNVMARIKVESDTLELVKKRNLNQSFKSETDTSRANLDTAEQLISNKLNELKGELNSKERKMWSKHFKLGEKAFYRPEGTEVNNPTLPRPNQDDDVD